MKQAQSVILVAVVRDVPMTTSNERMTSSEEVHSCFDVLSSLETANVRNVKDVSILAWPRNW